MPTHPSGTPSCGNDLPVVAHEGIGVEPALGAAEVLLAQLPLQEAATGPIEEVAVRTTGTYPRAVVDEQSNGLVRDGPLRTASGSVGRQDREWC